MVNQGLDWERRILQRQFTNLSGNWDIYMAFFELALSISDIVSFITPDKWMSKPFGEKFRKNQMCSRLHSITRAGSKVFDSATVDAVITLFTLCSNQLKTSQFVDKSVISAISTECISELAPPYLIDFLFSQNVKLIQKIERGKERLADYAVCENACATSDFYIVKEMIEEVPTPDLCLYYQLINTGTIEKYRNKWADKEISYGGKYHFPVVNRKRFEETLGKSYTKRAASRKIILKGLNLLDGCLDSEANIIPGKSTIVICSEDLETLKFLLGFINSKLPIFYIKRKYASSSYCGGITFTKEMINNLPLGVTSSQRQQIITIVDQILTKKESNPQADTSVLETAIDQLVYESYGLTEYEIEEISKA